MILFWEILSAFIFFILGASIASGVTCFASRIKTGESWLKGRSHCDSCGHILGIIDLIPVFGYVINKGHCRYCGAKISAVSFFNELTYGCFFCTLGLCAIKGFPHSLRFLTILTVIVLTAETIGTFVIAFRAREKNGRKK